MNNKIEKKAMSIGILLNFVMAFAGIYMYLTTDINAIFLDGTFSLMEGTSCIIAVIITKYSARENKIFPEGLYILEPLYSLVKCFVCFGLIAFSTYEAVGKLYNYIAYGQGEPLQLDAVVMYSLFMVTLCLLLSYIFHWYNKKTNLTSTILKAETKTAFVDGMLSLGIGITAIVLMFIPENSPLEFLEYIGDSAMTIALVCVVIREPIHILKECFIELSRGVVQNIKITTKVNSVIANEQENYNAFLIKDVKIYKVGKLIDVNLLIDPQEDGSLPKEIAAFREAVIKTLSADYPLVKVKVNL